jgi:hypothetical protein
VNLIFHPSRSLSRSQALVVGAIALIATALIASLAELTLDGVLGMGYHALSDGSDQPSTSALNNLAQGLANLAWMALALLVGSHVIKAPVAWLDALAHLALARWPLVLVSGYLAMPPVGDRIIELSTALGALDVNDGNHVMAPASHLLPAMELMLWSLPSLLGMAWLIWLMFDAYAHLTQTRGVRTAISFVVALTIAQGLSQLTLF